MTQGCSSPSAHITVAGIRHVAFMGVCVYSIEVPQTCRSGGTIHAPIILVSDQVIVACPFLLLGALRKPTSRQRRRQNAARDVRILRQLELDRRATHKHVPLDEAVRFPGYSVHRHALQIRRHERPLTPEKTTRDDAPSQISPPGKSSSCGSSCWC